MILFLVLGGATVSLRKDEELRPTADTEALEVFETVDTKAKHLRSLQACFILLVPPNLGIS